MKLESYILDKWFKAENGFKPLFDALTGEKIYEISSKGINFKEVIEFSRNIGGKNVRELTFHERGRILKKLAQYLMDRKDEFYPISYKSGATKIDSWIDIEGGISTLFTYASKGRRELPDEKFWVEGITEQLSKNGTFVGQHVCVPLRGAAIHINAFNFPVWGMLEKFAPTFLAGMPAIVKPASVTAYLTEAFVKSIIESNILPKGALQLICGSVGDLFEHLTGQDVITFTGSAETGKKLKSHYKVIDNNVRFNMEADSLNCSILGNDVTPEKEEFNLFIKEVVSEMTVKAGQKCTAIRRTIVPKERIEEVVTAIKEGLEKTIIGDPSAKETRMGTLAGKEQVSEVQEKVKVLQTSAETIYEGENNFDKMSSFVNPILLYCKLPHETNIPHDVEAFGPVNTIMPYKDLDDAIEIANKSQGSLVASIFTANDKIAKELTLGIAPYHGRILIVNNECAKESTGHGSPLPHLVHGGPGRAGGGQELGGIRGLLFYMQRTALQGHPTTLMEISNQYMPGAKESLGKIHPFMKYFEELQIGETFLTHRRTVTEADIVNFAGISGDYFYAHTDEIAAKNSMFEKRVAHGYFVLSAAAGLFVHPAEGPVIANYGLENLRFIEPVYIGDTIKAKISCFRKTYKEQKYEDDIPSGIVEWHVEVINQDEVVAAVYRILTLVKRRD